MFSVFQLLRGNEEWYEPWEHYADCADTCTYSQVLKLIHLGLSWIQTMIFVLVTGHVLLVHQRVKNSKYPLNLFANSLKEWIGCQQWTL